ncbi:phenylacetate-CoA ligase [Paenibacillus sp. UNCCL117]|uniref:CoF synthetase n=1 Tax=unclassified Paenibacillus TaxID=185978 RepID=UPI00088A8C6D|nr:MULTISPECIES: CoF synthetase [unclassified Paenibacillus]SDE61865.1 phenylacetate-CoA ligase [Paenibacillus sp. cl123]SFW69834.1 phenylacetate-CoA ligase [Paenibacillus sp. UNCCL117]
MSQVMGSSGAEERKRMSGQGEQEEQGKQEKQEKQEEQEEQEEQEKSELAIVRRAVELIGRNFPWYRSWSALDREGGTGTGLVRPETKDWEQLPLVTAPVLEAHYYTEDNPLGEQKSMHQYRTSGTSSGRRKTIFYSPSDEAHYMRIKLDVFRTILGTGLYRSAMADMGTGHAAATAVEVFRQLGMEAESLSFQLPVERHIERLKSFRPEVLYTMPSILDRILLASPAPDACGIRHVVLVGEIASPEWRARVAERMGLLPEYVTDTYGSIEIGTIAYYSHRHGRYLFAEGLIAEGVDSGQLGEGLMPLEDGEQVLVLTSGVREAFPALRYVTYDVVRDLHPIEVDGVLRPSFHSIVKRIGPDLKHGEKISLYDIEEVVYRHLRDASVRIRLAGNRLKLQVYSPTGAGARLADIRSDLENRIPEIGMMIRAGLLQSIEVTEDAYDDSRHRGQVKGKKIVYEGENV